MTISFSRSHHYRSESAELYFSDSSAFNCHWREEMRSTRCSMQRRQRNGASTSSMQDLANQEFAHAQSFTQYAIRNPADPDEMITVMHSLLQSFLLEMPALPILRSHLSPCAIAPLLCELRCLQVRHDARACSARPRGPRRCQHHTLPTVHDQRLSLAVSSVLTGRQRHLR